MAIITISRGSYSRGKEVAEKVALKLGYECMGREALLKATGAYGAPELELVRAMSDTASVLDSLPGGKEKYIAHIQAALTSHVRKDNVVYYGLAGQFLLEGVSHVIKVRIIAPLEYRIGVVMARDGVPRQKALRILKRDDEERQRWSRKLFLIDQRDCNLYDLVLNIDKCSVEDAIAIICQTAGFKGFQTTPESRRAMEDLKLGCEVKALLVGLRPDVEVSAKDGTVSVTIQGHGPQDEGTARELQRIAAAVSGVKDVILRVGQPA